MFEISFFNIGLEIFVVNPIVEKVCSVFKYLAHKKSQTKVSDASVNVQILVLYFEEDLSARQCSHHLKHSWKVRFISEDTNCLLLTDQWNWKK